LHWARIRRDERQALAGARARLRWLKASARDRGNAIP